ncbi:MAG: hypothetical protein IKX48_14495 [Victivallales bacterium]|nr:hypothetical protein [Victivallales bacterium]MBR5837059.1 hypothetical protein [Victivallales bacterium]
MTQTDTWTENIELARKLSEQRAGINYFEDKVPSYELPPLLKDDDGQPITTVAQWTARRAKLLDLFRNELYGYSPERPKDEWFDVAKIDRKAMDGAATLKLVNIHLGAQPEAPVIHLNLFIPNNRTKPAPAFLLICNRDRSNIDPTRKIKSDFWPAEQIVARGYAAASFFNGDVAPDKYDGFTTGIHAYLQNPAARKFNSWGTIAAWAWGGSRVMDYFETDPDIDEKHCAVTGHSRGGKTALWCGAQDERWALTISNCSGCSGAAIARRRFGESLKVIQNAFKHWFCGNYRKYIDREDDLPFDQHELVALVAPRAVYVTSADEDLWADQRGEWLAVHEAAPVWKLFGRKGLPSDIMPPLDKPLIGDGMGYHIRTGEHNYKVFDWNAHMDLADREFNR